MPPERRHSSWRPLLMLAVICVLLFGYGLDRTPFRGLYDDVDRALISREMARSGDWLSPTYHGHHLYTKPPLMYWVGGSIYKLLGRQDELPGALTSALCSLIVVLLCFWMGRTLFDRRTGLMAGLVLATSYLFLSMARQPLLDTVMMVGFAVAVGALLKLAFGAREGPDEPPSEPSGADTPSPWWWSLVAVGLGAAIFTKGPVVLPLLLIVALPLWVRHPRVVPGWVQAGLMVVIVAAIVVPWHVVVGLYDSNAVVVWKREMFGRLSEAPRNYQWTRRPFWFYLADMGHFLPWLPLLPAAFVHAWRRRADRRFMVLMCWAIGGFLFFSLGSATKRSYYLLPLYPAFSLLCAAAWGAGGRLFRGGALLSALIVALAGVAVVALPLRFDLGPHGLFALAGVAVFIAGVAALRAAWTGRWPVAFGGIVVGIGLLYLVYGGHVAPQLHAFLSARPFILEVAERVDRSERIGVFHAHRSMTAFYLNRQDVGRWNREQLEEAMDDGCDGFVIANPRYVREIAGLTPVLVDTLRSPFGKTKQLGLYRWSGGAERVMDRSAH